MSYDHGFMPLARAHDPQMRGRAFAYGQDCPAFLGRGHVARYLRARASTQVAEGVKAVLTDPAPDNERAVRAFRRAGFVPDRTGTQPRGVPVPVRHSAA